MNNKAQFGMGMVWGIVGLVVTIMVFVAFLPTIRDAFYDSRDQNTLNCVTTNTNQYCNTSTTVPCYNSTKDSETVACTFMALGTPLIVIFVVLGAIAAMMVGRAITPQQPQQAYPGY